MKPRLLLISATLFLAFSQSSTTALAGPSNSATPIAASQHHFDTAIKDYLHKDEHAAAAQLRKAEADVRRLSRRATGDAKAALGKARDELEHTARALDRGTIRSGRELEQVFARVEHGLSFAHRAQAMEAWSHRAYREAGYELKAAAQGLENAAAWTGSEARSEAAPVVADARAMGDKLARGGRWAGDEVAKGFESLGTALHRLGTEMGARQQAAPVKPGA